MVKSISINQIHTTALSCEPLLERTANGELLCICQCGGELYRCDSTDGGRTWGALYPTGIPNPANKLQLLILYFDVEIE